MYYIYGVSGPSLLIKSTDSMIIHVYSAVLMLANWIVVHFIAHDIYMYGFAY